MNDTPAPAPYLSQQPAKPASNFDEACLNMNEALDCLQRRFDALVGQLKPVTRLPGPQAPQVGQPMPPKPLDTSSPVVSAVNSWERTISRLADRFLNIEKNLDI